MKNIIKIIICMLLITPFIVGIVESEITYIPSIDSYWLYDSNSSFISNSSYDYVIINGTINVTDNLTVNQKTFLNNVTVTDSMFVMNILTVSENISINRTGKQLSIPYDNSNNWKYGYDCGLLVPTIVGVNVPVFKTGTTNTGLSFNYGMSTIEFLRSGLCAHRFFVAGGTVGDMELISGSNEIYVDTSIARINTSYNNLNVNLSGTNYVQTSVQSGDLIRNTVLEVNFSTNATVPLKSLRVGNVLRLTVRGEYQSTYLIPALTLRIRFGNTILASSDAHILNPNTASGWQIQFDIIVISIGATGTFECQGMANVYESGLGYGYCWEMDNTGVVTVDTTVNNQLKVSGQFSVASNSNQIQMRQYILEVL